MLFYLLVYGGAATVGAFGIVWLVRERAGGHDESSPILEATHLSQWAGLGKTHPLLASDVRGGCSCSRSRASR